MIFKDTEEVPRSCKYNDKKANYGQQTPTQKTKDCLTRTTKKGSEHNYSE